MPDNLHHEPRDITWHENAGMIILGALTILFGILPFFFWDMMSHWSTEVMTRSPNRGDAVRGGEALTSNWMA